jgi:DNA-binding LacI/PurR family transcriptional regulator
MPRHTTLADVARKAGVSLGTASNAFNRPHLVRPEVRQQVEDAAQAMGYHGPDPAGRLLMGGKANLIGVVPPGAMPVAAAFRSPYFRDFMLGIAEIADDHGAGVVVLPGEPARKAPALRDALVDGLILGHADEIRLAAARRTPVPLVLMDAAPTPGAATVRIDAAPGLRQAVRHLLDLGHRRFAVLSVARAPVAPVFHASATPEALTSAFPLDRERLAACLAELATAGIASVPGVEGYLHPPWTEDAARLLLDRAAPATAVITMSDRQAVALIAEAAARGLDVPRDLSVIGFDDIEAAARLNLTTIAQPILQKGRAAAELLFRGQPDDIILPVNLVLRGTTAPPRA